MKNRNHPTSYIAKKFCYFLSSLLVISTHKLEFKRYISTGFISKDSAIRLYDNILFNLQVLTSKISFAATITICIIFEETLFVSCLVSFFAMYLLGVITYYPFRMMINLVYPKEYSNGSNKNYLFIVYNFGLKDTSKIREYVPLKPILKNIGSYAPWKCSQCKKTNLISNRVCVKCNFDYYWKCYECETLNLAVNTSCIRCDMAKDRTEYLDKKWTCPKCEEEHENIFTDCWNCLYAKLD